ncbi:MAG: hypothetical protein AABZ06_14605 [Bdellovibrionota bacterium]
MNKFLCSVKIFGPAVGVFLFFGFPVLIVSLVAGHVPQPLEFLLFFAGLPFGIIFGSLWSRWQLGVLSLAICWLNAGQWTAYNLEHFKELPFSDLNRLGQDLGGVYLIIAGVMTFLSCAWQLYTQKLKKGTICKVFSSPGDNT